MNAQTLILVVMSFASTTTSQKQNATNVLDELIKMKSKTGFSFALNKAIRRQRKLVSSMS